MGAVLVCVRTDERLTGIGSVGVGNGGAAYIIEHCLQPLLLGSSPFDTELLWEKMFRSTINYGRKGLWKKWQKLLRTNFFLRDLSVRSVFCFSRVVR